MFKVEVCTWTDNYNLSKNVAIEKKFTEKWVWNFKAQNSMF